LLENKLATGGMAEIFLATQKGPKGFKRLVAIKRILPQLTKDREFVTMFLDEARLVALLSHPNIVQIFEFGQVAGGYFLVMEYVHGVSLSRLFKACLEANTSYRLEYWVKIVSLACQGLDYAHNFTGPDGKPLNLIHRDVSPQNLMLSYDGVVKLIDFGIARADSNIHCTHAETLKGKLLYMSPEQIMQEGSGLDRRSDIFSLGVILYELTTGQHPFPADNDFGLMWSIIHSQPPDPRTINDAIPEELAKIILCAIEKDRSRRYHSARRMRDDLEHYLLSQQELVDIYTLRNFLIELIPPVEVEVGNSVIVRQRTPSEVQAGKGLVEKEHYDDTVLTSDPVTTTPEKTIRYKERRGIRTWKKPKFVAIGLIVMTLAVVGTLVFFVEGPIEPKRHGLSRAVPMKLVTIAGNGVHDIKADGQYRQPIESTAVGLAVDDRASTEKEFAAEPKEQQRPKKNRQQEMKRRRKRPMTKKSYLAKSEIKTKPAKPETKPQRGPSPDGYEMADKLMAEALKAGKEGKYHQAIFLYRQAMRHNPSDRKLHWLIGKVYEKAGELKMAIRHYKKYIKVCPECDKILDAKIALGKCVNKARQQKKPNGNDKATTEFRGKTSKIDNLLKEAQP